MARAELRYLDEAKTKQELVVFCTSEEYNQLDTKAGELTHKHYQLGVSKSACDAEWAQFRNHLFGWSLVRRIEEVEREGILARLVADGDTNPY